MAEITAADTTPKITDEIKKAYYELIASHAAGRSSDETLSLLADFAKLLPAEEEARHNMLTTLKSYLKSAQSKGDIKLRPGTPTIVRKNLGTIADNVKADLDKIAPARKKTPPITTLTDDERIQKLAALQQVYAEALNAPETIKNQQRELKNIRHDRVFADKPLNKSEKTYAEQIRGLAVNVGANLDGITAEEILLTCRKAVEEKTLQTFKESYKAALTPEKVKEIEQQMHAFDLKPRVKGKPITLSDDEKTKRKDAQKAFVNELQTSFVKEQGYALWGGNGNILKALRETIDEYKKENGLTRDKDDRKKDDTRGKKPEDKGDTKMAEKDDLVTALNGLAYAYDGETDDNPEKKLAKALKKLEAENKPGYDLILAAKDEDINTAVKDDKLTADDEFKNTLSGALYAHKNRDKFREAGIPEEEWAEITSKEIFDQKKAELDKNPLKPRENTPNPPAPPTNEQADWVKEKVDWYTKYNDEKHLADFNITRADSQFEVKFEGGTITYESKENVAISAGASYKVYEALLREDHNKDRPVQFPANASEHLTSMLYAASILNETGEGKPHEMLGVDKEKIKMDLIEQQLRAAGYGDAEIKKVKDYYDTHEGKEAETDTRGAEEGPTRPEVKQMAEDNNYSITKNDDGHVVIEGLNNEGEETFKMDYNPADGKYSYSTPESAEPLADIEDQDAVFLKGKADSFIKIQDHLQTQVELAKKEAGGATLDDAEKQQQTDTRIALVEAYSKDPALFRRAMGGLIGKTEANSQEHTDLRTAQIDMLRARAKENGTLNGHHNEKDKDARKQAQQHERDSRDLIMAKRLGLTDEKINDSTGKPIEKLEGKKLEDFKKEHNISTHTETRLKDNIGNIVARIKSTHTK